MSTNVVKPVAFRSPPTTAQSRRRAGRRRPLALAVIAATVAAVGAGTWLIVGLVAGSGANALSAPITAPAWTPTAMPLAERGQVLGLQRQLVLAGYAIKVDGNLDRVARSALADYLRPNEAHPLTPFDAGVEGARRVNRHESIEGAGRDPLSPVGAADPVRDLALVGIAPHDPIVPATSPSTTMALLITVSSARSLLQRRWNASRSM